MNESFNKVLSINNNYPYSTSYQQPSKNTMESRKHLFQIVKEHEAINIRQRMYRGYINPPSFAKGSYSNDYTLNKTLNKINKLESSFKDGYTYYLDTETLGERLDPTTVNVSPAQKLNDDIFSITELSLKRRKYKDGVPVGEIETVFDFTSSPSKKASRSYIDRVFNNKVVLDKSTVSTLSRYSGYGNKGNYVYDENKKRYTFKGFDNNAKINEKRVVSNAADLLSERAQFEVGTDSYNKELKRIFNEFQNIISDDRNTIVTVNGVNFDIPVLTTIFERAGIDISDEFKEKLDNGHVDLQQILKSTSRDKVAELIEKARANGVSVDNNLKLETLAIAYNEAGASIDLSKDSHVASVGVDNTAVITEHAMKDIIESRDKIQEEIKATKIKNSKSTIYHANNAVMLTEDDVFFSDSGFYNANNYNPTVMEAGHFYNISTLDINKEELPEELQQYNKNKILKIEDIDTNRTSYMLVDSDKNLQDRILDTGNVLPIPSTKKNRDRIKESTEIAVNSKGVVFKENLFKTNSSGGFSDLENYLIAVKHYQANEDVPTKEDLAEKLLNSTSSSDGGESISEALNVIFNRNDSLVHERALNLVNSYDDFVANESYYSDIVDIVNSTVGSYDDFVQLNNLKDGYGSKRLYDQIRTSTAANTRNFLENKAMSLISEEEALDFVLSNDEVTSGMLKKRIKEYKSTLPPNLKESHINQKDILDIKKKVYSEVYDEFFSMNSDNVKRRIFGGTSLNKGQRVKDGFDILSSDGSYSRFQANSRESINRALQKEVYQKVKSKTKDAPMVERDRMSYLNSMIGNLKSRGIISKSEFKKVKAMNTPDSVINYLTDRIYEARTLSNLSPKKIKELSSSQKKKVAKYNDNHNMKDIYKSGDYYSILDSSAEDFFEERYPIRSSGKDGVVGAINKEILENAQKSIGAIITNPTSKLGKDSISDFLINNMGWNERNVDNFIGKYLSSSKFTNFKYRNGKSPQGFSHEIIESSDGTYLISTPMDRGRRVTDAIANGADIDELKKHSLVLKLPKVEKHNENRVVKFGDQTYKAIIDSVYVNPASKRVKNGVEEMTSSFNTYDTLDSYIGRASSFNLELALENFGEGMEERANDIIQRSWKPINESKSLSAIETNVSRLPNGQYSISKSVGMNRSDRILGSSKYIGDSVYALDIIFKENEALSKSFAEIDKRGSTRKYIEETVSSNVPYYNRKSFSEFDTSVQLWFVDNIQEIAQSIINSPNINIEDDADAEKLFKKIALTGREVLLGKDTGDIIDGLASTQTYISMTPHSRMSNTSRPLLHQNLNASTIHSEEMIHNYNMGWHYKHFNTSEELLSAFDVKLGLANHTENSFSYAQDVRRNYGGASDIGFRTKVKIMSPAEFQDSIHSFNNMSLEDLISSKDGVFAKKLSKLGVDITEVDMNQIRAVAANIASNTNIYEDSSLISPYLQEMLGPSSITSVKFEPGYEKNLKIGDYIDTGDKLSFDGSIKSDKNRGRIVGIKNGTAYIQTNEGLGAVKLSLGPYEKTISVSAPMTFRNSKEIQHALIKYMGDGANIIANPSINSHQSFGSLITGYFNAVTSNVDINDKATKNKIRASLSKFLPHVNLVDHYDGVMMVEGKRQGNVNYSNYLNFINDVKKISPEIGSAIDDIEKKNVLEMDIGVMADNTVYGYQGSKNIGKGAGVSYRGQQVMGAFMGGDSIEELLSMRNIVNDRMESLWKPIMDADMRQIMNDPKFISAQEQVANMKVALANMVGESFENQIIKDFALKDASVASSILTAYDIPDVFTYNPNNRVHAYKIDLQHLNFKVENPVRYLLEKMNADRELIESHDKYVSHLMVPALDPNYLDETYTLSRPQKKLADLINKLNAVESGDIKSVSNTSVEINNLMLGYFDSLIYELTDSDGINKKSMKSKSLFSQISKGTKVAAPIKDSSGTRYKDFDFARTSTINGKYYSSLIVSKKDFLNMGLDFKTVGEQLSTEFFDESDEALAIIKQTIKNRAGGDKDLLAVVNESKAVREILSNKKVSNLFKDESVLNELGISYMQNVGIFGQVMRDPAVRTNESFKAIKIRIGNVSEGSFNIDAVSAHDMKADIDGDSINIWFRGLAADSSGKVKLKNLHDEEIVALKNIMEKTSNINMIKFLALADKMKGKEEAKVSLKSYMDDILGLSKELENIDYVNSGERFAAIYAKIAKSTIGQISNPNYYLRSAMTSYYSTKPYDANSYKAIKNINFLTDLTEQSLIDVKTIGTGEGARDRAIGMAELASSYRFNMERVASTDERKRKSALKAMYLDLVSLDNQSLGDIVLKVGSNLPEDQNLRNEAIDAAIDRILSGKAIKSTDSKTVFLEEVLSNINEVFSNENSVFVFHSSFVKQTAKSFSKYAGKDMTDKHYVMDNPLDVVASALSGDADLDNQAEFAKVLRSTVYLDSAISLNGTMLNIGDSIYSTKPVGDVGEGMYNVISITRDSSFISLNIEDVSSKKTYTISERGASDIAKRINHMSFINRNVEDKEGFYLNTLADKYKDEITSNLEGFDRVSSINLTDSSSNFQKASAKAITDMYDMNLLEDVMITSEVLKNKGYITEDDASSFIKAMNDRTRKVAEGKRDTRVGYKKMKANELLKLQSLKDSAKVSNHQGLKSFLKSIVTEEEVSKLRKSTNAANVVSNAREKVGSNERIDIAKLQEKVAKDIDLKIKAGELDFSDREELLMRAVKDLHETDNKAKRVMFSLSDDYSYNQDLIKGFFNLNLEKIERSVSEGEFEKAIELVNDIMIPYGDYIGFKVSSLDDSQLDSILKAGADSNINVEVVSSLKRALHINNDLKTKGVIRPIIENTETHEKISSDTIERINKRIREEAELNNKNNKRSGKFILDEINNIVNKAKSNKTLLWGAAALGATAIGGSLVYGRSKLNEKQEEYVRHGQGEVNQEDVKTANNNAPASPKFFNNSNPYNSSYRNSGGASVSVKGRAPSNANSSKMSDVLSNIFAGSNIDIKSSIRDDREKLREHDIDKIMSDSIK